MTHSATTRWAWRITGILLLLLWGVAPVQAREKTDIVVLANGTRLQVEIDSLDRGLLKAGTNEMGTLNIEWDDVAAVSSNFVYDLTVEGGEKYVGTLEEGPEEGTLVVRGDEGAVTLELPDVVLIYPLEASFWKRIKGSVDIGYSLRSESNLSQLTFDFDASYYTHRLLRRLSLNSYFSDQDDSETTQQSSLKFNITRFLLKFPKWGTMAMVAAQQNSEQGLDRRVIGGAMLGRSLVATNQNLLLVFAGAAVNHENYSGLDDGSTEEGTDPFAETSEYNWEGVFLLAYQGDRYNSPKFHMDVGLLVFPGITNTDRLRVQFQGGISYEVFSDFTVGLTSTYSYDSLPPVAGVEETSYVLGATIGYSFN